MAECENCDKVIDLEKRFIAIETEHQGFKEDKAERIAWEIRIEGKIDRMLWAVIGLCCTIIIGGFGAVLTYGMSKL